MIASGLPVWSGLLVGSLAWGPVSVLIATIAVNARRQSFENDAALRGPWRRASAGTEPHPREVTHPGEALHGFCADPAPGM